MEKTVPQLCESRPYLTPGALRWLLFNRDQNGLKSAVIKIGRKLLIDEDKFDEWVRSHREAA